MRRIVAIAIAALLALPATAGAQLISLFGPGKELSSTEWAARVTGEVSVSFVPSPSGGCVALAACAYRGKIVWTPGAGGTLDLLRFKVGGRVRTEAALTLGEAVTGANSRTVTEVRRSVVGGPSGSCADERSGLTALAAHTGHGQITLALSGELSATRCAGPLPGDLASVAPRVTVPMRTLSRGGARLDFRAQRAFASHGLAGTLTSTLIVTLGPPHRRRRQSSGPPPGGATRRTRFVTEALTVTAVGGRLAAAVSGSRDADVCVLLDSCGLAGTLTIAPRASASTGGLVAIGPAGRPYVDFLTAVGLSTKGRSAGIQVEGAVQWNDPGTVSTTVRQASPCTDAAVIGDGTATLALSHRTLTVGYRAGGAPGFGGVDLLRTRCPGPILSSAAVLAHGTIPRSALARRRFTVRLAANPTYEDQGYALAVAGHLNLSFRLGPVSQQVVSLPASG